MIETSDLLSFYELKKFLTEFISHDTTYDLKLLTSSEFVICLIQTVFASLVY